MELVAPQRLVEEALEAYRQCWIALRQTAEPIWTQLELTTSQLKGLFLLEVRGSLTVGHVAEILSIGRPSASIMIDQLVTLGLATRTEDSSDRRRTLVTLTAEGRSLTERLHQGDEEFMRGWFDHIDDQDLGALRDGLLALAAAIRPALIEPSDDI